MATVRAQHKRRRRLIKGHRPLPQPAEITTTTPRAAPRLDSHVHTHTRAGHAAHGWPGHTKRTGARHNRGRTKTGRCHTRPAPTPPTRVGRRTTPRCQQRDTHASATTTRQRHSSEASLSSVRGAATTSSAGMLARPQKTVGECQTHAAIEEHTQGAPHRGTARHGTASGQCGSTSHTREPKTVQGEAPRSKVQRPQEGTRRAARTEEGNPNTGEGQRLMASAATSTAVTAEQQPLARHSTADCEGAEQQHQHPPPPVRGQKSRRGGPGQYLQRLQRKTRYGTTTVLSQWHNNEDRKEYTHYQLFTRAPQQYRLPILDRAAKQNATHTTPRRRAATMGRSLQPALRAVSVRDDD